MKVTSTPAEHSTVVLEVEVTAEQVQKAIDEAVRHQARGLRMPGFRPGRIPRPMLERALGIDRTDPEAADPVYDDARDHLYRRSVVEAAKQTDLVPVELPAAPDWQRFVEGEGAAYTVTVPIRPVPQRGDYAGGPFSPGSGRRRIRRLRQDHDRHRLGR